MARVFKVDKSRKEQTCGKCRQIIPVGSPYLYATPMHRAKMIRCTKCGLKSYETSGSEYVQTIGALGDNWRTEYGIDNIEGIIDTLTELMDNAQDSLDNMPEQLQYGPTGEMLQERIDGLESAISELEDIDVESAKEDAVRDAGETCISLEDFREYYKDRDDLSAYYKCEDVVEEEDEDEDGEIKENPSKDYEIWIDLTQLPDDEDFDAILDLPYIDDNIKSELNDSLDSIVGDAVDSALSNLA